MRGRKRISWWMMMTMCSRSMIQLSQKVSSLYLISKWYRVQPTLWGHQMIKSLRITLPRKTVDRHSIQRASTPKVALTKGAMPFTVLRRTFLICLIQLQTKVHLYWTNRIHFFLEVLSRGRRITEGATATWGKQQAVAPMLYCLYWVRMISTSWSKRYTTILIKLVAKLRK